MLQPEGGMIEYKIEPKTPDAVCELCQQQIDGVCRAMSLPHTKEEEARRSGPYGMECDDPHLKEIRTREFGVLYHTK